MMFLIMMNIFIIAIFSLLTYLYYNLFNNMNINFSSMYECGFMNLTYSRLYFSLYMYIYVLMFLILDLEILIMSFLIFFNYKMMMMVYIFIILLLMTIMLEWYIKSLDWVKF